MILVFLLPLPNIPSLAGWNDFIRSSGRLVAFVLFGIAALTDHFDGKIARRQNLVTNFGRFLDPIADKMLVISVLIALIQVGRLNALPALIVIFREFVVTGIRLLAAGKGKVIAASVLGKAKTVSQIVAILIVLAEPTLIRLTGSFLSAAWIEGTGNLAILVSLILTLVSGYDYLRESLSDLKG